MSPTLTAYAALAAAIVCEVSATTHLQDTEQFYPCLPTAGTLIGYGTAFYMLSLALRGVPLGVAYAIWAGIGIVLTALVGLVVFRQSLDAAALVGIGMIVGGVIVMQVFSTTAGHRP